MTIKEYNTDKVHFRILESNLIENYILDNSTLEEEDFWSTRAVNMRLAENKPYALLIKLGFLLMHQISSKN